VLDWLKRKHFTKAHAALRSVTAPGVPEPLRELARGDGLASGPGGVLPSQVPVTGHRSISLEAVLQGHRARDAAEAAKAARRSSLALRGGSVLADSILRVESLLSDAVDAALGEGGGMAGEGSPGGGAGEGSRKRARTEPEHDDRAVRAGYGIPGSLLDPGSDPLMMGFADLVAKTVNRAARRKGQPLAALGADSISDMASRLEAPALDALMAPREDRPTPGLSRLDVGSLVSSDDDDGSGGDAASPGQPGAAQQAGVAPREGWLGGAAAVAHAGGKKPAAAKASQLMGAGRHAERPRSPGTAAPAPWYHAPAAPVLPLRTRPPAASAPASAVRDRARAAVRAAALEREQLQREAARPAPAAGEPGSVEATMAGLTETVNDFADDSDDSSDNAVAPAPIAPPSCSSSSSAAGPVLAVPTSRRAAADRPAAPAPAAAVAGPAVTGAAATVALLRASSRDEVRERLRRARERL